MQSTACVSCVKDACAAQYSSLCSANCSADPSGSACQNAVSAVGSCGAEHCSSQCATDPGAGGGGDSSDSGGASNSGGASDGSAGKPSQDGSGGAGTPTTPNCVKLETCCGTLPGDNLQVPCFQAAGFNNDGPCLNLLKSYQNANQCIDGGGNATAACTIDDTCTKQTVPASAADQVKGACEMGGGVASDACASKGVVGCCTVSGTEICSYKDGGISEDDCSQTGGTWSTTP